MIDITQHNKKGEFAKTCYTGTKDDLINAGLATPSMFETVQGRARTSQLCKNYHPESGIWNVRNHGKHRNKQLIWDVTYFHERFIDATTLKREKEAAKVEKENIELAKKLQAIPGKEGEKLRNLITLSPVDQFANATFNRVVSGEISMEEATDIVWKYSH